MTLPLSLPIHLRMLHLNFLQSFCRPLPSVGQYPVSSSWSKACTSFDSRPLPHITPPPHLAMSPSHFHGMTGPTASVHSLSAHVPGRTSSARLSVHIPSHHLSAHPSASGQPLSTAHIPVPDLPAPWTMSMATSVGNPANIPSLTSSTNLPPRPVTLHPPACPHS